MCIYEQALADMANNSADQKLISDIKDAVRFLNEEKLKLTKKDVKAAFKVKNQNGVELKISDADKNSLTIAMILHEKGKFFMKCFAKGTCQYGMKDVDLCSASCRARYTAFTTGDSLLTEPKS